jgi:cholesterol transport system auxiliary component
MSFSSVGTLSFARGLMLAAMANMLSGCISLFPDTDPAQLYRFGATVPAIQESTTAEPGFNVFLPVTGFDQAAAADRILTVTGNSAAYIKDARWVSSSVALFDSAVQRAFDTDRGPARLVSRGEATQSDYVLKLDMRTFEARYTNGQDSAPTIIVELHATLDNSKDQTIAGDHNFKAKIVASDNRVGAIVQAFDEEVDKVLGELLAWVIARGEIR